MLSTTDIATIVDASAIGTIGIGLIAFALLSGVRRNVDLLWAGLFAALYALRMILGSGLAYTGYAHAALEYLVPIPAALLFARYFGARLRKLNVAIVIAFVVAAAIAIPYEILIARPHALNPYENALVLVFMAVFAVNIALPSAAAGLVRAGAAIFALYVINEHLRLVVLPWRLSSEPIGFLIFLICLVVALMRGTIAREAQLLGVESELRTARGIQESIIPSRPPDVPGLEIAAVYKPASQVGGDFYDFVPLPDNRLGVFIADVSGHGVPAALVASMLKIAIAAQDHHASPSDLLAHLNRLFCGRLQRQFFTAAYAVISPQSIEYATGGHPPLLLNGRELATPGFVLGRRTDVTFVTAVESLRAGDVIALYTDGVVERPGWSYERLRQEVAARRPVSEIVSGEADDDMTLVVIATRPEVRT